MTTPRLTAILALSADGALGDTTAPGGMPWPRLSRDMRRFRELTMGKVCLVGHATYRAILAVSPRGLPGRRLVVLSRGVVHEGTDGPDCYVSSAESIPDALALAESMVDAAEVYVIGGAEVYRALLPLCERVYLTTVCASCPGADVRLDPAEVTDGRRCLSQEWHAADADNPVGLRFSEWGAVVSARWVWPGGGGPWRRLAG